MSGGVDSSVCAGLLLEQGYECSGVMMRLHDDLIDCHENACCKKSDIADAYGVAQMLGIPFRVVDFAEAFEREVIEDFCAAYEQGLTPNPCIVCNRHIKFGLLHELAHREGYDYIATGHYARNEQGQDGLWQLKRGLDRKKDQSYVLHMATQEHLSHLLLPLGALTKAEVRDHAARLGLKTAQKAESQDICFVGDEGYVDFLEKRRGGAFEAGPIVSVRGELLGKHRGLAAYTEGQRKGLGISAPHPLYVLERRSKDNTLVVGSREELGVRSLVVCRVNWISGQAPASGTQLDVVVRYQGKAYSAHVFSGETTDSCRLELDEPCCELAAGQSAVLYQDDVVLGGGTICRPARGTADIV